jgi:hypothetical protein
MADELPPRSSPTQGAQELRACGRDFLVLAKKAKTTEEAHSLRRWADLMNALARVVERKIDETSGCQEDRRPNGASLN